MTKRWRVVVPGCLITSGISIFFGLLTIRKSGMGTTFNGILFDLLVCVAPLGGPLAEPLAEVDYDPVRMIGSAVVLLALIVLHPLRPGIVTGVVSGLAIAVWVFWGLAMTYDGV